MSQTTNRQDIQGDKMDYQDGFEDGVKFTREVIIANIRLWAEKSEDGAVYDDIADRLEFGTVDYDL
jgi:hypothetical protein